MYPYILSKEYNFYGKNNEVLSIYFHRNSKS